MWVYSPVKDSQGLNTQLVPTNHHPSFSILCFNVNVTHAVSINAVITRLRLLPVGPKAGRTLATSNELHLQHHLTPLLYQFRLRTSI